MHSYDQHIAAARAQADAIPWLSHVEEFERTRLATNPLFQNLPPTAWMRTGIASDNPFSVRAMAFIIAGHVTHHLNSVCVVKTLLIFKINGLHPNPPKSHSQLEA